MKVRDVTIKFVLIEGEDYNIDNVEDVLSDFIWSGAIEPSPLSMSILSEVSRIPTRNEKKKLREIHGYKFEHEEDEG